MMKTVAIIQARLGSTRLPNKMLLHLHGYPVIEWVYRRVASSRRLDQVIVAVPDTEKDELLVSYLESIGASVYQGSENDLVARYLQVAEQVHADLIIRVCGDNPLVCGSEIDRLVDFFEAGEYDYAYNHIPRGNRYPDGLGAEVCRVELLRRIDRASNDPAHREHLFNYVWDNQERFRIATFDPPESLQYPELKLDIDTLDDYGELMRLPFEIDMTAEQIVSVAQPMENQV